MTTPLQYRGTKWQGELMSTDQNILSVLLFSVFSTVGTCFLEDITRDVKPFTLQLYSHTSLHKPLTSFLVFSLSAVSLSGF